MRLALTAPALLLAGSVAGCSLVYDPDKLPAQSGGGDAGAGADGGSVDAPMADGGTDSIDPASWPYTPRNVALDELPPPHPAISIGCDAAIDTSGTPGFTSYCGALDSAPRLVVRSSGGVELAVLVVDGLSISGSLEVVGSRPLVIVADGDLVIGGEVRADANLDSPGPGGNPELCVSLSSPSSAGGDGSDSQDSNDSAAGGGGGSFGSNGRRGGDGDELDVTGGMAGATLPVSDPLLVPLHGGCPGGRGGAEAQVGNGKAAGGGGGGALQLSAKASVAIGGTVSVGGGGGRAGTLDHGGGGGGGSGGAILIEGDEVSLTGTLAANGGGGGAGRDGDEQAENGSNALPLDQSAPGGDGKRNGGQGASASDAPAPGEDGSISAGGGGGGGGMGRVHVRHVSSCTAGGTLSAVVSGGC